MFTIPSESLISSLFQCCLLFFHLLLSTLPCLFPFLLPLPFLLLLLLLLLFLLPPVLLLPLRLLPLLLLFPLLVLPLPLSFLLFFYLLLFPFFYFLFFFLCFLILFFFFFFFFLSPTLTPVLLSLPSLVIQYILLTGRTVHAKITAYFNHSFSNLF